MEDKIKEIKELVEKLNRYCYEYYVLDSPSVSDRAFDIEYDKLVALEKETGCIDPNSPTQRVGGEVLKEFEKVEHSKKLWSLDKAQTKEELREWMCGVSKFVSEHNRKYTKQLPKPTYIVTKKFDGLTIKTDYDEKGNYVLGSTRGTGLVGENVTSQVSTALNLPKKIEDIGMNMKFHGEGLMTKKAFKEYNKTAETPLKNLRNGVAGAIRNLDPSVTAKRKIMIEFYNINDYDNIYQKTYQEQLEYMKLLGLPVTEYTVCNSYNEVVEAIDKIEEERPNLPYDIDGAVIKVNEIAIQEAMGYTIKFPRFSLAYKYEAEETTTIVKDVEWSTSRTGRINPVAILEPVDLMGVEVKRATLNNLTDIERKGIKIGSEVFIRRSNDVIPEITGITGVETDTVDITPPARCPSCNHPTEIEDSGTAKFLMCNNPNCKAQLVQTLSHFVSRQGMNIIGLSEKTIEAMVEKGAITNIVDIYKLQNHKQIILSIDKMGTTKYNNLIRSIEASRSVKLSSLIYALGIKGVGISTARDVCEHFNNSIESIVFASYNDFLKVKDVGDITARNLVDYFNDGGSRNILFELLRYVEIETEQPKTIVGVKDNPLKGKHVYPTGKFSLKKSDLKAELEKLGAIVDPSYKKSLDFLICGNDISKSGKADKAIEDGVSLMTEEEMMGIFREF